MLDLFNVEMFAWHARELTGSAHIAGRALRDSLHIGHEAPAGHESPTPPRLRLQDRDHRGPVITEDQITHPDTAEHEVLLSRIWSDVYGLRAELIAREASRDDPERANEFQEAAVGALWYLARLLSRLSTYSEKYGKAILHGTAEYNAEALIRLAGWTGEVTSEQARELRFVLAQVGEWDRVAFSSAMP